MFTIWDEMHEAKREVDPSPGFIWFNHPNDPPHSS